MSEGGKEGRRDGLTSCGFLASFDENVALRMRFLMADEGV